MKLYMVICGEGRAEVVSGYPGPEGGGLGSGPLGLRRRLGIKHMGLKEERRGGDWTPGSEGGRQVPGPLGLREKGRCLDPWV